jgi:hypothetical protein
MELLRSEYSINGGGFIPEARVRLGPPPFKKTSRGFSPVTIDRLANNAWIKLAGRNSWKKTAKEISIIIAKAAVAYKK